MRWLKWGRRSALLLWSLIPLALLEAGPLRGEETALDRYVAKPDSTYAWRVVRSVPGQAARNLSTSSRLASPMRCFSAANSRYGYSG